MERFPAKHPEILLGNIRVQGNLSTNELLGLSFAKHNHISIRKQPLEVFCEVCPVKDAKYL